MDPGSLSPADAVLILRVRLRLAYIAYIVYMLAKTMEQPSDLTVPNFDTKSTGTAGTFDIRSIILVLCIFMSCQTVHNKSTVGIKVRSHSMNRGFSVSDHDRVTTHNVTRVNL